MPKSRELAGQRFGRLVAVELHDVVPYSYIHHLRGPQSVRAKRWRCVCDCGAETVTFQGQLLSGRAQSCGCLKRDNLTRHGGSYSRLYRIWRGMKQRCLNPRNKRYADYGGRGVTICDAWIDFAGFQRDMGEPPGDDWTLDRIDNDLGYQPGNCRWATRSEQQRNKRANPAA